MEMSLSQKDECRTWEEDMYWKYFHAMHFYIVLPKDVHHHLVLPPKFAEHVSSNLPDKVSLIGPSSSSWDVEVSKTDNQISLVGDGWKHFAKAYNLEENLMMVFTYKQNLSFEVLIFDQKNMCEKESSYFVKKSLPRLQHGIDRKRSLVETASTECGLSKKPKKDITEAPRTSCPTNDESFKDNDNDNDEDDDEDPEFFVVSDKATDEGIVEKVIGSKSCLSNEVVTKEGDRPSDEAAKSKAETARKPSEDITARELNQLNETEQIPTENEEVNVLTAVNKGNAVSDVLSVEAVNEDSLPTTNNTRKPGGKRGRRPGKRPLPNSVRKLVCRSARKPSEDITARELNQLNEAEQIPTDNEEVIVFTAVNKGNAVSDVLSVEAVNEDSLPTTNNTRKPGGKRGRRPGKRPLPNSVRKLVFKSGTQRLSKEYVSHRRPVTDEEKEDALRRANEALTEGGFIVVMRPTGVYKRFYLTIPAEWMHKNLPSRHKQVVLRLGEKTWLTMFHYNAQKGHSGGLATGWKNFAIQNNLEEADVCVFKPASKKDDANIILDVEIFRVVQEITPLTPLICSV